MNLEYFSKLRIPLFLFVLYYSFWNLETNEKMTVLSFLNLFAIILLLFLQYMYPQKQKIISLLIIFLGWVVLFVNFFLNELLSDILIINKLSIILLNIYFVLPILYFFIKKDKSR